MKYYILLGAIAAVVTYIAVPIVRRLAWRIGAMTPVRKRDVHTAPTPRLGGLAMLAGVAVAMGIASAIPFLEPVFGGGERGPWAVLAAGALVCLLGAADDLWDLDWLTKLSGQILAAVVLAWQGIQLITFPIAGITVSSSRFSLMVTVLVVVVAINAVNFVDGLDGLAAGLIAIGAAAFFAYTYLLSVDTGASTYASLAAVVLAVTVGVCLGFLPYNWHPSSIFMGDSGSMLLGLLFAAATIAVTGQIDPAGAQRQAFPAFLPILLPVLVLALPLLDVGLAVVRRVRRGESPFHADRMHLHHRLLRLGHSHRRAVLIMYLWTAVVAVSGAALAVFTSRRVLVGFAVGVLVATALTLGPLRGRRHRPADDAGPRPSDPAPEPAAELVPSVRRRSVLDADRS
ncbi:MAG: undecaprenyl/decaprenyl-phosphate alpha-N-acetylglucosaminyl 1-phosphate transferase [Bifidobacteriaceae bacterium]|nr:undecaprenyl/decaprenyl-phosphate alpha-N-acetylglucosaminyl 1-phosphate transferase [Bifidobacteriaceae bacterium]